VRRHTWVKRTAFGLVLSLLTQIGLAPAWAQPPAGEAVYYHTDVAGSVRMVTDEGGAAIEQYNYTPFGAVLGGQTPGVAQPRGYAGKERDAETSNDYFGARYYASQIGRFTTVDPVLNIGAALADPQRWNRYAYAMNNPLRYVDPDGREGAEIRQNQLINAYFRGEITRDQLKDGLMGNPTGTQVAIAAGVMTGGAAAEAGLVSGALVWGRGLLTAAVGWALRNPEKAQEVATTVAETAVAPPGYNRPLGVGDLGIAGNISQLKGTFTLRGHAATVSIDMIEGNIQNPFQVIKNITETARRAGAKSLRIQGTIANETLYDVLKKRYGLRTEGGIDYFDIPIQ
jgi:RHS repeat-associated protein